MLVTFYNAVICSIIMFGSVCWGGNVSKLDRGRLRKDCKKKQVMLWESHWTVFKTLHEKRLSRKLMQILNDPTHTQWDTTLIADVATWVEDFYFQEQIQTIIKPCFYPRLCQFLMKIIPVIKWVCACVKTSVADDNFLTKGWGCMNLMIFYLIWEFLCFGLTQRKHYSR